MNSESQDQDFTKVNTFQGFRDLAKRKDLSNIQKIGFPDSYRIEYEKKIFKDISSKLNLEKKSSLRVLDIGSGCSTLPARLSECGEKFLHEITLLDSEEMLANLEPRVLSRTKQIIAKFPDCEVFLNSNRGSFDAIICYSVFQYPFTESIGHEFLNAAISLLGPRGRLLIGDLPNTSMKMRFLQSEEGKEFSEISKLSTRQVPQSTIPIPSLDDSVVLAILREAREKGFHAFVIPQNSDLPMSNRREDILIVRP